MCDELPAETTEMIVEWLARKQMKGLPHIVWYSAQRLHDKALAALPYHDHIITMRRTPAPRSVSKTMTGADLLNMTMCVLLQTTTLAIPSQRLHSALTWNRAIGAFEDSSPFHDRQIRQITLTAKEKNGSNAPYSMQLILDALPRLKTWFPNLLSVSVMVHCYTRKTTVPRLSFYELQELVSEMRKTGIARLCVGSRSTKSLYGKASGEKMGRFDMRKSGIYAVYGVMMSRGEDEIRI